MVVCGCFDLCCVCLWVWSLFFWFCVLFLCDVFFVACGGFFGVGFCCVLGVGVVCFCWVWFLGVVVLVVVWWAWGVGLLLVVVFYVVGGFCDELFALVLMGCILCFCGLGLVVCCFSSLWVIVFSLVLVCYGCVV